jgi:glycosyltransferase involved in cell wall biosynthesis
MTETEVATTKLSVVIPAYNEAANVGQLVTETIEVLARDWREPYELLLVDDGSKDGTAEVMSSLAAKHPTVRVIVHPENRGLGGALQTGYAQVRGEFVSFIPGDGQVGVSEVLKLQQEIGAADLIVSVRERTVPFHRNILSWGMRTLMWLVLGFDPTGMEGVYVIRRAALQRLRLRARTGLLNFEIPMRCYALGLAVKRGVSINTRPRLSGTSKVTNFSTVAKTFYELFKLRIGG